LHEWTIPSQLQCIGAAYVLLEDTVGATGSSRWFSIVRALFADGFESGDMEKWSYWTP
jgi:hypothetical protein